MSVMVDVTTDIIIPPRSVNVLEVMGNVYKEDGTTSAGSGLDVMVTVGSQATKRSRPMRLAVTQCHSLTC